MEERGAVGNEIKFHICTCILEFGYGISNFSDYKNNIRNAGFFPTITYIYLTQYNSFKLKLRLSTGHQAFGFLVEKIRGRNLKILN